MIYYIPLVYLLLVIAHTIIDWYTIKKRQQKVNHKKGMYYYCAASFFLFFPLIDSFPLFTNFYQPIPLIVFPIVTRAAFFDPLLNWFLGQHFLFEGVEKPEADKSWWDRLEAKIGLPVIVYRIIYFSLYLISLFYYYVLCS